MTENECLVFGGMPQSLWKMVTDNLQHLLINTFVSSC